MIRTIICILLCICNKIDYHFKLIKKVSQIKLSQVRGTKIFMRYVVCVCNQVYWCI